MLTYALHHQPSLTCYSCVLEMFSEGIGLHKLFDVVAVLCFFFFFKHSSSVLSSVPPQTRHNILLLHSLGFVGLY